MKKELLLVSCLVLNGSRSGYRRIIRNLILASFAGKEFKGKFDFIYVFQKSGWDSLNLPSPNELSSKDLKIIILDDFKSKWSRGFAEQLIIPYMALKNKVDKIFMPATFGLILAIKPTITFVHTNTSFSVGPALRGRGRSQQLVHNFLAKITAKTSSKLLFTTEQTHSEYSSFCHIELPKLILGNGLFCPSPDKNIVFYNQEIIENNFLLCVSQFYRLKNFDGLILAFLDLKREGKFSNLKLVLVGTIQEEDYFSELKKMVSKRDDIFFLHNISDDYLNSLYNSCLAYCFFSHFEGYSLTPAEAILYGKHIALSDIPTHREVYGDDFIYADPTNIGSIKSSLEKLVKDSQAEPQIYSNAVLEKFSLDGFLKRLTNFLADA